MSTKRPASQGATLTPVAVPRTGDDVKPSGDWKVVPDVVQDAPPFTKAWYAHVSADLFVWTDTDGSIAAFQFCFDKENAEQMVAWDRDRFVTAGAVDTGETDPLKNRAPVMRAPDERTQRAPLEWQRVKAGLPDGVVTFIETTLKWDQSRGATET